jgi:hypothetical protein
MAFVVIARDASDESSTSHEGAQEAYQHAIRLLEEGMSYVAIRDEDGQELSSGDFAERYLDPLGDGTTDGASSP